MVVSRSHRMDSETRLISVSLIGSGAVFPVMFGERGPSFFFGILSVVSHWTPDTDHAGVYRPNSDDR